MKKDIEKGRLMDFHTDAAPVVLSVAMQQSFFSLSKHRKYFHTPSSVL